MPVFISKSTVDNSFAMEHIEELGGFFDGVAAQIPAEFEAERITKRFTFCIFKLTAATRDACDEAIANAWEAF